AAVGKELPLITVAVDGEAATVGGELVVGAAADGGSLRGGRLHGTDVDAPRDVRLEHAGRDGERCGPRRTRREGSRQKGPEQKVTPGHVSLSLKSQSGLNVPPNLFE